MRKYAVKDEIVLRAVLKGLPAGTQGHVMCVVTSDIDDNTPYYVHFISGDVGKDLWVCEHEIELMAKG